MKAGKSFGKDNQWANASTAHAAAEEEGGVNRSCWSSVFSDLGHLILPLLLLLNLIDLSHTHTHTQNPVYLTLVSFYIH